MIRAPPFPVFPLLYSATVDYSLRMATQISLLDALFEEPRPLSVSEFTAQVKKLLEGTFGDVWIEGEISNFKRHTSGHWYFTLKDQGASLRCASFRNQNRFIRFLPEDGLAVRIRGRISVYEPRGEYQVMVSGIEPVGLGALQLAFEQLKKRLRAEGLFDDERKRPLPMLPGRVGVVTSPGGAALQDILRVLRRRNRAVRILVAPARVQGEGAAAEIAAAIEALGTQDVDVIIVGRGGGSLEDLWAFNEEVVARAIAASTVPVISAVGHETDFTIADFVADMRAPTPSASAEIVARAAEDLRDALDSLREAAAAAVRLRVLRARGAARKLRHDPAMEAVRTDLMRRMQEADQLSAELGEAVRARLRARRENLIDARGVVAAADPRRRIEAARGRVAALVAEAGVQSRRAVESRREATALAAGTLSSLSPLDVLMRGYAIVRDTAGRVVRSPSDVAPGELVRIRVVDGELTARREDTER